MRTKHVVVLPYDEKWKQDFIVIKNEISQALGDIAISIDREYLFYDNETGNGLLRHGYKNAYHGTSRILLGKAS